MPEIVTLPEDQAARPEVRICLGVAHKLGSTAVFYSEWKRVRSGAFAGTC